MTDILIRNVSQDELKAIDAAAERSGLSRNEYLRRRIASFARLDPTPITAEDLIRTSELTQDLLDESVMRDAWS